jgi:hypothetical protein
VPIPQKSVVHIPQGKVLAFFMGILTGITHLKDMNEGPHPLAHDWLAIRAWGLVSLAHNTSTTFPDAEFSWQGDKVGLGYDAALATLASLTYDRLFLTGFHYPRNPVSLPRLQKMVHAVEYRLGRRPRRRTDLVEQRLEELEKTLAQRQDWLAAQLGKQNVVKAQLETLPKEMTWLKTEVARLEATYRAQGREEKPHSQLAKARHRLAAARKKLKKAPQHLQKAQRAAATHRERLERLQAQHAELTAHLAQLQADNARNPNPVTIILRIDAGFGTGPNVTWLAEMGYIIYTKAHNAQVTTKLKAMVKPDTRWTRVGKNAEMTAWGEQHISNCPYPLTVALERFHTPDGLKHSTLLAYRDDGQSLILPAWFDFYNSRQTIEAGIKETNVVFKMHPLKMRSRGGILLQEQFSLFAANFALGC